ncbi:hypothetical protein CGCF415_v009811 [Colletotrichum fructicola]|uniref:Uncharacterized protein n=1 Tax=Colletotrichum fructicola (strain Nara gc5) TaxID=1213859 RepID=L2FUP0_COLFN|nr:uncharacterized protein CGMCC3_g13209 [Colletotrichum fructicola]KAF4486438.1 hypothetical protein CGGC5_v006264 [Colletotrichum fructicola Nara gc5]KAI8288089.1 hypothetical protein K4K60_011678 [Colletotrichum sp. SAR11_57]KAE9570773.1 hypothetical protein CGMCC3_g13209 [Colletotrichum fructicola]KAF4425750.1 hypothetical protein CFRS1_v000711 [Colletotrichum fructicola]KAF4889552.1 hypothetical protein CGCFRS4_v009311 [Colletotrichum fructicola]
MFSVAGPVVFSERTPWDFRPAVPSPLSSSPIRASLPLSPISDNTVRQTQSSPIPAPKFKYASRPTRPNPVLRRREDVQENRRKAFLQNVRQRQDDKTYQRRDMEGTLLKSDWDRDMRQRYYFKQLEGDAIYSDADIEDAATLSQNQKQQIPDDVDDMMVDAIAQEEQDELDALLSSYSQSSDAQQPAKSDPYNLSDDEDYDELFMSLVSQESAVPDASSQEMDMS